MTVTPQYTGIPTGAVKVLSGTTTVCKMTLVGGKGHCSPAASALKVGSYSIVAVYSGSPNFTTSKSTAVTLKVT